MPLPMIGSGLAVELIMMSASFSRSSISLRAITRRPLLRQRLGAFTGAVGDHHFAHVMFAKMARYQLNGFPGADQ